LSGELDLDGQADLINLLQEEIDRPGLTTICIDMSEVSFLGSAGVGALLRSHRAAQAAGLRFTVTGLKGSPLWVLQITGVLHILADDPASRDDSPQEPTVSGSS
jgi:anti-anti-sigma factor